MIQKLFAMFTDNLDRVIYLDLIRELKKVMEYEGGSNTSHSQNPRNNPQEHRKENRRRKILRKPETVQTTTLLRLAKSLTRILER